MSSVNQFVGLAVDPTAGGSTRDILGVTPTYAAPTIFVPVTTAQVNQGYTNVSRANEVRNQRGNPPAASLRAAPSMTFTCRAYPALMAFLLPRAWGGAIVSTGTAPAALTSKSSLTSTSLPPLQALVVRGTQMDRLTGLVVESAEISAGDDDIMVTFTLRALWHKHFTSAGLPTPTFVDENPYHAVRVATKIGSAGTAVACVGDVSLSLNNGLVSDVKQVYCKNENLDSSVVSGRYAIRQYPGRHKLGDPSLTGRIGFGTERPDMEDRLRLAQADKLVFEFTGDPITPATTPPADELLRITLPLAQITDGSADDLTDERDPGADYEFEGVIDPSTGTTAFIELVRKTAVSF